MLAVSRPAGGLDNPNISWKSSTASCRQSRRFLEYTNNNFLNQVTDTPAQGDAIFNLMVTNASELISDIKIGGSMHCSDHTLVEFTLLRDIRKARSTLKTQNFRKANFQLFKELLRRASWETVLRDRGAEHSSQISKDAFHRAKDLSVPRCKKSGKEGKRLVWLSQDLLVKLKSKRELHRRWKQGQLSWELYRDAGLVSARARYSWS